ncbi:TetR/AcrR family transcriptional regulator [Novosphingobium sp. JCM 18896]|uniref:TetR/AcrR family transcriptional regulator n=1 Tax=Novosphingobium sp. JCM 18896 TaxID=2989731 RepID=UPI0022217822|nr:TetR/AcrR family transcriptional regulator [Novosphingobium sp. JCM 18896]MCW1428876.1 TetR/AcrR family transcriptional regulator [Novosphingobium sp. JCM 18896]
MDAPRRNKGFDETHQDLIETAVRLISERGVDALSIAALAREMGINRTTVYYHFENREALLHAVSSWATAQLGRGTDVNLSQPERIGLISRFAIENPELTKLWIDDFVSGKDIRDSYSGWNALVEGTARRLAEENPGEEIDAEVYCVMLIAASVIGPRVYRNSVNAAASTEEIVAKFVREHQRALARDGVTAKP